MSLYYEAARFLDPTQNTTDSLKSRIFAAKDLKNKPVHILALVSEATKWSAALAPVVEAAGVLQDERKLTPALALLLSHDLLLAKKGVAAPKDHVLRKAIERHKARLSSEFTRARLRSGCGDVEAWKKELAERSELDEADGKPGKDSRVSHPRWVRLNALKTSLNEEIEAGFLKGWTRLNDLRDLTSSSNNASRSKQVFATDRHVPDLIATPAGTDLTKTQAYRDGRIILQDKASCFPATLMDPGRGLLEGDIIDACAAPGNKTTHLAALISVQQSVAHPSNESGENGNVTKRVVFACERDAERSRTLQSMVDKAGASETVRVLAKQDFLKLKPSDERFANVSGILLDPSCSGSGIVGRDEGDDDLMPPLVLPRRDVPDAKVAKGGKKRKRGEKEPMAKASSGKTASVKEDDRDSEFADEGDKRCDDATLQERLKGLSDFQTRILEHAMSFPHCRRIVYSTCSVHAEENEAVVMRALGSKAGSSRRRWKPLIRDKQNGMRVWPKRGSRSAVEKAMSNLGFELSDQEAREIAEACIRCDKGTEDGTMGFFVCGFEREIGEVGDVGSEPEWEGFGE